MDNKVERSYDESNGDESESDERNVTIDDLATLNIIELLSRLEELDHAQIIARTIAVAYFLENVKSTRGSDFIKTDYMGDHILDTEKGETFEGDFYDKELVPFPLNMSIKLNPDYAQVLSLRAERLNTSVQDVFTRLFSTGLRVYYDMKIEDPNVKLLSVEKDGRTHRFENLKFADDFENEFLS